MSDNDVTRMEDDDTPEWSFVRFVKFAKKQNSIKQTTSNILKAPEAPKQHPRPSQNYRMAANQTEPKSLSTDDTLTPPVRQSCTDEGCQICPNARHQTQECRKFAAMSGPDKAKTVKEKRLCIRCLQPGHIMRACTQKDGCKECGSNHHTLLHGVNLRPEGPRTQTPSGPQPSS